MTGSCRDLPRPSERSVRLSPLRLPDEGPPDEELSAMRRAEFAALALSTALLREPYLFSLERTYSS